MVVSKELTRMASSLTEDSIRSSSSNTLNNTPLDNGKAGKDSSSGSSLKGNIKEIMVSIRGNNRLSPGSRESRRQTLRANMGNILQLLQATNKDNKPNSSATLNKLRIHTSNNSSSRLNSSSIHSVRIMAAMLVQSGATLLVVAPTAAEASMDHLTTFNSKPCIKATSTPNLRTEH